MTSEMIPWKTTVLNTMRETDDIFTLTVACKKPSIPGQFMQVSVLGVGESPISISSYHHSHMKLTVRQVGNVTNALAKLKKGDNIFIRGPYGRGYPMKEYEGKNLILIGAGCGVAALKSIIDYVEHHRAKYKNITLFFGYRNVNDVIYKKEVQQWKKKYKISIAMSKESAKTCLEWSSGHITDVIASLKLDPQHAGVFICGPPAMITETVDLLKKKGFVDSQVYIATERLMYCATGMCCHCMIRGKFTCKDGPVFRYDKIGYYAND